MSTVNLTPTSYVVLGLLAQRGPSTPYDLKTAVAGSIGYFWAFPHAQLYTEPARLAAAGYLDEVREEVGRRRRTFAITEKGRKALATWLSEPLQSRLEVRDPGLLKLFFGDLAEPGAVDSLSAEQLKFHEERLQVYRALDAQLEANGVRNHARKTLKFGLCFEEAAVRFWEEVGR